MAKPEHDVSSTTHRATAASNASPSPAKKKKTTPKRLLATWWLEILSFLLAGLALIALAVTLYRYEHRPVAEWPLLITINALVSIYGAMFESSMLFVVSRGLAQNKWLWFGDWSRLRFLDYFDQAARGPAGAYRLCWKAGVRSLRSLLAFLGGLIIILSMAIDPFLQQIIKYYACEPLEPSAFASVYKAHSYQPDQPPGTLSPAMRSKMLDALSGSYVAAFNPPPSDCPPEANCTADPYWTAGVCASCEDVTDSIVVDCDPSDTSSNCSATLPAERSRGSVTASPGTWFRMGIDLDGDSDEESDPSLNSENAILGLYVLANWRDGNADPSITAHGAWSPRSPDLGAARCVLQPCAQRLRPSRFERDLFEEDILEAVPLGVYGDLPNDLDPDETGHAVNSAIPRSCLANDTEEGLLRANGFLFSEHAAHPPLGSRYCGDKASDERVRRICDACSFAIPNDRVSAFQAAFGQDSALPGRSGVANATIGAFELALSYRNITDPSSSSGSPVAVVNSTAVDPLISQAFYRSGRPSFTAVNTTLHNLASAISTQMRQDTVSLPERDGASTIVGTHARTAATHPETCVRIAWGWIALPAVLLAGGVVFMAAVVSQSAGMASESWKSCGLPLLFFGFEGGVARTWLGEGEGEDGGHESAGSEVEGMKRWAEGTTVRVDEGGADGPSLVRRGEEAEAVRRRWYHKLDLPMD